MTTTQVYYSYAVTVEHKSQQEALEKQWEKDRKTFQEEKTSQGFVIVKKNGKKIFDYYPESA